LRKSRGRRPGAAIIRPTHLGELFGIPPTGKKVKFSEIGILRIADGKVVESWYDVDMLGLMGQLGVGG
jgi:predicted ester cyclase